MKKIKEICGNRVLVYTDDEIKVGDWFISIPRGTIHKCTAIFENNLIDDSWEGREKVEICRNDCVKILNYKNNKLQNYGTIFFNLLYTFMCWFCFLYKTRLKVIEFYEKANEIEKRIKDGNDLDTIIDDIIKLNEKSFHQRLSARIRELSKMVEIKYDVKILKNEY